MKRVLITGGAGFIGSSLAIRLVDEGNEVTVLDNLSPQIHGETGDSYLVKRILGKVRLIRGDVRNADDWMSALTDQDVVVHFAAETGTGQSMYEIKRYTDVNIGGTALLLDLLVSKKAKPKKLVLASSRAVYGEGKYRCKNHADIYPDSRNEQDLRDGFFEIRCPICKTAAEAAPTDEQSRIAPTSIYGLTKYAQEQMLCTISGSLGIETVAYRYQNVYGPGQSLSNPYTGILSIFSTRLMKGAEVNVFEDGLETRDFVYIDDVVAATLLGIERPTPGYRVYNVGSGIATTVADVANTLRRAYNSNSNIVVSGNCRVGDIRHNRADLSRIQTELGFTPSVSFERGIARFADWVRSQECSDDGYERSLEEMRRKGLMV